MALDLASYNEAAIRCYEVGGASKTCLCGHVLWTLRFLEAVHKFLQRLVALACDKMRMRRCSWGAFLQAAGFKRTKECPEARPEPLRESTECERGYQQPWTLLFCAVCPNFNRA